MDLKKGEAGITRLLPGEARLGSDRLGSHYCGASAFGTGLKKEPGVGHIGPASMTSNSDEPNLCFPHHVTATVPQGAITYPKCGNLWIFLSFRFYVKSILDSLQVLKRSFLPFLEL